MMSKTSERRMALIPVCWRVHSPAVGLNAQVVKIKAPFVYIRFWSGNSLFYKPRNAGDVENWTPIGSWTPHDNSLVSFKESKFTPIVADVTGPMTPSHSRVYCSLFAVCFDYDVSWWVNPIFLEIFVVFQRYTGWRRGMYKCSFSLQQHPLSVRAPSEPPFYTAFRLLQRSQKLVCNFKTRLVQFSSVQDGIYALGKAHNHALRPVSTRSGRQSMQSYLRFTHADFVSVMTVFRR